MDRTFYYVAIAFFGMVNGLFNQTWVLFSLIHVQILAPALLVRQRAADIDVRLADGLDRHHHRRRHPGGALRARRRGEGRFDRGLAVDLACGDGAA